MTVSPSTATLYGGQTQQFTALVTNGSSTAVTWGISPSGTGTISASGLYTAPASIATQQTITVVATSQADPTRTATATVTLMPPLLPITVTVTPGTRTLYGGQTQQFTASVANSSDTAVTWSIPSGAPGNIGATGLYTAPATVSAQQSLTIIATSHADASKSGSATVTLMPVSISVSPNTASVPGGQSQQFTATVTNTLNTAVTWSIGLGSPGAINGAGLYTAPANVSTPSTLTVTATSQADTTKSAAGTVTLLADDTLTLAPTLVGPNVTGTAQAMTATLKDGNGTPIAGATIQFAITGANATIGTATSGGTGVASFTYTGTTAGNDAVQASFGAIVSNTASVGWVTPVQPISTSTIYGRFFPSPNSGLFIISPTATPAFTQAFPALNFNPPSGTVPGNTSSVTTESRPFTNVTTDLNGNFTGTITAQGNGYQAGVGPLFTFQAVFTGSFTIAAAGNVPFNFYTDDGFILGIGGGATRVSGPMLNAPGATAFTQLPVMGAYNRDTAAIGNQVVVNFPGPGTYPYEVDYTECCADGLVLTMTTGASHPTGLPPSGTLTLTPNSVSSATVGTPQTFVVVATTASGSVVPNLGVALIVNGANARQLNATTDASGRATFTYSGAIQGADNLQAVASISDMESVSNVVTVPWTLSGGTGSGPQISIVANSSVTLPDPLLGNYILDRPLEKPYT